MLNLNEVEQKVLSFWSEDRTFERSVQNRQGAKPFVIYEGPPTANGKPGIHHVLTRTFKDMIARFQTMNGRYVERKAGWDEHGLPVEIEVQKELSLHTKPQIEAYGVQKFNEKCAASTKKYITDWEALTRRMGYWLDFQNAYRTSDPVYIQRVWKILRQLYEDGLIYRSNKVVPWACDSGTAVSNHEVAQGYKKVKHLSAYVLFQLCDDINCLLAWTTTPWTLPGNMALAVNPNLKYKVCRLPDERRVFSLKAVGTVEKEISGSALVGQEYYHPITHQVHVVYAADFVKEEQTGIVHIAPAFGEDDFKLWQEKFNYMPIIFPVDEDGRFNKHCGIDSLVGKNVLFDNFNFANKKVLEELQTNAQFPMVLSTEEYEHEYPHNWRTGKPLIYYLRPSWYVNVNVFRSKMIEANQHVRWYPDHIKEGRFGDWLKGEVDWAISRERWWGTPLPFYGTDAQIYLVKDGMKVIYPNHAHKPEADEEFGPLKRTPEVLDCWFDSGAMPFAAFDQYKQADVICEAVDQTRGWFYSLLAIGTAIKGEAPYKRALCLGHILDKDGNKMAKTKGNVVDPWKMFEKYGADVVRWYMVSNPVGNSLVFKEEDLRAIVQNFINRLWNCYAFFQTYADIEKPSLNPVEYEGLPAIDRWILCRLAMLVNCTGIYYDQTYEFDTITEEVEKFVDYLSNVWVRANRNRFWNTDGKGTDQAAFYVLHTCLTTLCKVIAPIMPFLSEHLWSLLEKGSVHLQDYPQGRRVVLEDEDLVKEMDQAIQVVTAGHHCRDEAKVKVRQVLQAVYVPITTTLFYFENYVKEELNVKEVKYRSGPVELDLHMTEALLAEGFARDFVRVVQDMRKKAGLQVTDRIILTVDAKDQAKYRLDLHKDEICKKLLVVFWLQAPAPGVKVGDTTIGLSLEKANEERWDKVLGTNPVPKRQD